MAPVRAPLFYQVSAQFLALVLILVHAHVHLHWLGTQFAEDAVCASFFDAFEGHVGHADDL